MKSRLHRNTLFDALPVDKSAMDIFDVMEVDMLHIATCTDSISALSLLSGSHFATVRRRVAENAHTSVSDILVLSHDIHPEVQAAAGRRNPSNDVQRDLLDQRRG